MPSTSSVPKLPNFVQVLYKLVEDPEINDIISWSNSGESFYVHKSDQLAKKHLPAYFKTDNYQSFTRQLNNYQFHKIQHPQQGALRADPLVAERSEWAHEHFLRGQTDRLALIEKRPKTTKAQAPKSEALVHSPGSEVTALQQQQRVILDQQETLTTQLNELRTFVEQQVALVQHQTSQIQQRQDRQDEVLNQIVGFLANSNRTVVGVGSSGNRLMIEGGPSAGTSGRVEEVDDSSSVSAPSPAPVIESPSVSPSSLPHAPEFSHEDVQTVPVEQLIAAPSSLSSPPVDNLAVDRPYYSFIPDGGSFLFDPNMFNFAENALHGIDKMIGDTPDTYEAGGFQSSPCCLSNGSGSSDGIGSSDGTGSSDGNDSFKNTPAFDMESLLNPAAFYPITATVPSDLAEGQSFLQSIPDFTAKTAVCLDEQTETLPTLSLFTPAASPGPSISASPPSPRSKEVMASKKRKSDDDNAPPWFGNKKQKV